MVSDKGDYIMVKLQRDYSIMTYVDTFSIFGKYAEAFLDSLVEDIDYKRVSDLHGMVVIVTNKEKHKISFIVNNIRFDYRDGNLYFGSFLDALRERPYILQLVVTTLNEMLYRSDVKISNDECILGLISAFILLQGWFSDVRVLDVESQLRREENYEHRRENEEFWEEYYEFNPNDI